MLGEAKAPSDVPAWEAMATELTVRGDTYRINELVFPPGEWVEVPAMLVERLQYLPWAQVRQQAVPDA